MARILYQSGIPRILPKWEAYLSGLMDSAGISEITLSSTYRTPLQGAMAIYNNAVKSGTVKAAGIYAAPGKSVIQTMIQALAAKKNPGDTIAAMAAKITAVGAGNVSKHCTPPSENFVVFDVSPQSIPENKRASFEQAIKKNASKVILPQTGEPVYHIEFGGVKMKTVATGGSAILLIAGVIVWYIISKGKIV